MILVERGLIGWEMSACVQPGGACALSAVSIAKGVSKQPPSDMDI